MSDANPTEPYPRPSPDEPTQAIADPADSGDADAVAQAPASLRRRRWPWVLLVIVVVVAALAAAAEFIARAILPDTVRAIVISELDLPADQQLAVQTEGMLLPQLISGRLDSLRLTTESVTVEGLTGAVDVTARGVPLRGGDLGSASGTVRIAEAEFATLLEGSDLPIETVTLDEPDATITGSIPVFAFTLPLSLTVTPSAEAGELLLTPVRATIGDFALDAAEISDRFPGAGDQLAEPQRICIADQLPAGVTLTSLAVTGKSATAGFEVNGGMLSDAKLQEPGICP